MIWYYASNAMVLCGKEAPNNPRIPCQTQRPPSISLDRYLVMTSMLSCTLDDTRLTASVTALTSDILGTCS
eukprot:m.178496 g.178496  ORF g.178496 m.178496 type:complete len:71 (-) comp14553_c0_seq1:1749-1961(-)